MAGKALIQDVQKYSVIHSIKSSTKVQKDQSTDVTIIYCTSNVIVDDCYCSLSRVVWPVGRLELWQQTMIWDILLKRWIAIRSTSFGTNSVLDIGCQDFISNGSRFSFLRIGFTIAIFPPSGKVPSAKDRFTTRVITGAKMSQHCLTNQVGAGSSSHCLFAALHIKQASFPTE